MKTSKQHWIISIIAGTILVVLGLGELMIRRSSPPNGYLLNKSVAGAAFLMIALSYSLSAIHHFTKRFKAGFALRRPFGLVGYGLAVLHVILTLLVANPDAPDTRKFQLPDYYIEHWPAMLLSAMAFVYFTYAFKISIWPQPLLQTSGHHWRRRLRYGYIAVLLAFTHAMLLKIEGWLNWLPTLNPVLPPLSLIIACIGLLLILLKIWQLARLRRLF